MLLYLVCICGSNVGRISLISFKYYGLMQITILNTHFAEKRISGLFLDLLNVCPSFTLAAQYLASKEDLLLKANFARIGKRPYFVTVVKHVEYFFFYFSASRQVSFVIHIPSPVK